MPDGTDAGRRPETVRNLLKAATADLHAQVDACFGRMLDGSEAGYRRFLLASLGAIEPLEAALGDAGVGTLLPDWPERARSSALRMDLAELGVAAPPSGPAAALAGAAQRFGALYVLEGSRLGAKLLARQVLASPSAAVRSATRYLRHGDGRPLWASFLERLESSPAVRRAPAEAVAGATAAFARFLQAGTADAD